MITNVEGRYVACLVVTMATIKLPEFLTYRSNQTNVPAEILSFTKILQYELLIDYTNHLRVKLDKLTDN